MRRLRGRPLVRPSSRRSSSRARNGIRMRPTICIPTTTRRSPPTRCSQNTISPASAPTSATPIQRRVNTVENPNTKARACATVRARCVPASAASPAMFTRNAGTSGRTHGETNERIPAPNAIATFTRTSLGCLPRVHDEVEPVEPAGSLEHQAAFRGNVPRARVVGKDERDDTSEAELAEAIVDERARGLGRISVAPGPGRQLVRDLDLGAFALDGKEPDLTKEVRGVVELDCPEAHARRLTRREGHRARKALRGLGDILRWGARRPLHDLGRSEDLVQSRR